MPRHKREGGVSARIDASGRTNRFSTAAARAPSSWRLADLAIGADHPLRVAGRRAADVADEPHAFARAPADVALRKSLVVELDRIVVDQSRFRQVTVPGTPSGFALVMASIASLNLGSVRCTGPIAVTR